MTAALREIAIRRLLVSTVLAALAAIALMLSAPVAAQAQSNGFGEGEAESETDVEVDVEAPGAHTDAGVSPEWMAEHDERQFTNERYVDELEKQHEEAERALEEEREGILERLGDTFDFLRL